MECLAGIFEWSILLGFLVRIDLVEKGAVGIYG
jgi:hypothetical protein